MTARPNAREPQLDGLRFLAFLAVYVHHTRPDVIVWGSNGVDFFFALSGFLITRLLVGHGSGRIGADLRRYYVRRTLRIFPLYYAVIALIAFTGSVDPIAWLLTFTYNIYGFVHEALETTFGHFWTLCVEEQFYLVYPLLLLATPARLRYWLLGGLIAGSVVFQIYAHLHWNFRAARILLPYCGEHLLWGRSRV